MQYAKICYHNLCFLTSDFYLLQGKWKLFLLLISVVAIRHCNDGYGSNIAGDNHTHHLPQTTHHKLPITDYFNFLIQLVFHQGICKLFSFQKDLLDPYLKHYCLHPCVEYLMLLLKVKLVYMAYLEQLVRQICL